MGESYEYLVRGAQLKCNCGSKLMKLGLPTCHGVYAGQGPVVHQKDCVVGENILCFGSCKNKNNKPCAPIIVGDWMGTNNKTMIVQNGSTTAYPSVTMDSFLVCNLGGLIEPVKSGQMLSEGSAKPPNLVLNFNAGEYIDETWAEIQAKVDFAVVAIVKSMEAESPYNILSLETLLSTKFDYWVVTLDLSTAGFAGFGAGVIMDRYGNAYYTGSVGGGIALSPFISGSVGFGTLPSKKGENSKDYTDSLEGITESLSIEVFVLAVQEAFDINPNNIWLTKWAGNQFVLKPSIGVSISISKCVYSGNILE